MHSAHRAHAIVTVLALALAAAYLPGAAAAAKNDAEAAARGHMRPGGGTVSGQQPGSRVAEGDCVPEPTNLGSYVRRRDVAVALGKALFCHEDLGHGGDDPFGNPLSFIELLTLPASEIPAQELLTYPIPNIADPPMAIGERTITEGTFKVPSLRNLQLTAPYFHNGGQRTIRQVVEFYDRGGDFREHNVENVDFEIGKLHLTRQQIDDLVAFLGRPLTDMRVVRQSAPFDHPQLFVPNGHSMDGGTPRVTREGVARDLVLEIPEVGRRGGRLPSGFLE
jgi:hypothetical protein